MTVLAEEVHVRRMQALGGVVALAVAGGAHVSSPPKAGSYKLKGGDTLSKVAKRTGVSVDALADANGIENPDRVRAGRVLTVPVEGEPAPAAGAPLPPLPSPVVVVGGARTHRVVAGENLAAIAKRYDTTVATLVELNGVRNPNLIREGKVLQVPGASWLCPVQGPHQFGQGWGQPRPGNRRHLGVDVFAARGTPVVAPVGGTMQHAPGALAGIAFYLRADDGNTYYGAHLDTVAAPGRFAQGAVLGTVGSTGNAKGSTPHLHFEVKPGGGPSIDPFPTLDAWC